MAVQPKTPLLPAESAKLPLKMLGKGRCQRGPGQTQVPPQLTAYLGAGPAKQGKGELADGHDHQVHTHSLPGGAGSLGGPPRSTWGPRQAENAETPLVGVHGVAVWGQAGGVSPVAVLMLVVQDKALGATTGTVGAAGEQGPAAGSGRAAGSPHLLLQAVHHPGQQPRLQVLVRVGDEEVHVMALCLPPEGQV